MATKENIYKQLRNQHEMTRDAVCDEVTEKYNSQLTSERLERIENNKFQIHPEEVLLLSKVYNEPTLCNHYCSNECPIGKQYVPEVKVADSLAQIVLEMIASLNTMKKSQERLIEITADGVIDDSELKDFVHIQNELERISITVESLQLWAEQMIAQGKINIEKYQALKSE